MTVTKAGLNDETGNLNLIEKSRRNYKKYLRACWINWTSLKRYMFASFRDLITFYDIFMTLMQMIAIMI